MIKLTLIITTTLIFFGTANAQMGGGGGGMAPERAPIPEVDGETFIYQIPDKWYPYSKKSEAKADVYIFPTGQNPEKWKELLQLESFTSTLNLTDATQVYDLKTGALEGACDSHSVTSDKDNAENAYSMHQWTERCSQGEEEMVSIRKAILGNERLYMASIVWKYEPKDWEIEKWQQYLDQTYVCDGTPAHNCAPPNRRAGNGGMGGMGG